MEVQVGYSILEVILLFDKHVKKKMFLHIYEAVEAHAFDRISTVYSFFNVTSCTFDDRHPLYTVPSLPWYAQVKQPNNYILI